MLQKNIEQLFFYAFVWSIGATCDTDSRTIFDNWLRTYMQTNGNDAFIEFTSLQISFLHIHLFKFELFQLLKTQIPPPLKTCLIQDISNVKYVQDASN